MAPRHNWLQSCGRLQPRAQPTRNQQAMSSRAQAQGCIQVASWSLDVGPGANAAEPGPGNRAHVPRTDASNDKLGHTRWHCISSTIQPCQSSTSGAPRQHCHRQQQLQLTVPTASQQTPGIVSNRVSHDWRRTGGIPGTARRASDAHADTSHRAHRVREGVLRGQAACGAASAVLCNSYWRQDQSL